MPAPVPEPTAPRRGPYRRGVETRARVVDTAIEVFGRSGYHGGTLQAVAERAGITAGAVVRLFGSKENLLLAVFDEWDRRQEELMTGSGEHGVALLRRTEVLMAHQVARPGLLELHVRLGAEAVDVDAPAHTPIVERYARVRAALLAHLLEASAAGDLAPLDEASALQQVRELTATMDGLELQWLLDPSMDLVATYSRYFEAWLARLSAHGRT
ncbi:TetR/AcrR family transcriptional regulator [Cellulomonas hominis]